MSGNTATRRVAWSEAVRSVLAPLLQALLREGWSRAEVARLFESALRETGGPSRGRLEKDSGRAPALSYVVGVRLVSRWQLDPPWTSRGRPRSLPIRGRGSFATLAESAGVEPALALRELRRLGLVAVRAGRVSLRHDAYVPAGIIERLDILGRDGAEFLRIMLHNLAHPPQRSMLQRKASYDNVGSAALGNLRVRLRETATRVLAGVNQTLARVDRDRNPKAPGGRRTRVSFGIYVIEEPVATPRAARTSRSRRPS